MSVSPHDGGVQSSGLIIPENIPGDDLKPARLEYVARTLRTAGSGAVEQAELAESTWSGMPAVLESPQGAVIYGALASPSEHARAVDSKFDRVAAALENFAEALRPIKSEFAAIKRDAEDFRGTITWDERVWVSPQETKEYYGNALTTVSSSSTYTSYSQPRTQSQVLEYLRGRGESARVSGGSVQILAHWTESSEHIDQNNVLMDRLADAYAKLQNAEADCANEINRQRETCLAEVEYIEAWQLKQSDELTVVMPWGSRVDEDRNCGESFWWGAGNAGKEMLEGVGALFGYNSLIDGWEWDRSWQTAGQAWWGALTGIGSLLVVTSPPLLLLGMAGVPVLKDAVGMGQEMMKGLLAWDTWAENPAEAAGRVVVNVGSIFIPGAGEVAAAVKAMSLGSRIVDLAADGSRLATAALDGLTKLDGLLARVDGFTSEVTTAIRDLVTVGTHLDLPDSSLLQVGARTPDAPTPPGSFLDDGTRPRPGDGDAAPPRPVDDGPAPVHPDRDTPSDSPSPDGDPSGPAAPGHDPGPVDAPPTSPGDGTPGGTPGDGVPGDGTPGDGTPGDGTPADGPSAPLSQSEFAQLSAAEQMAVAKAELGRGSLDFDSEAAAIKYGQDTWNGYADELPAKQAAAVRDYTGASYTEYNGALRGERPMTPELRSQIALIDKALAGHPVPENLIVSRGSGFAHLTDDPTTLIGQVITDEGYLSTSLGSAAFSHKPAIFHLAVPKGTPGMYVGKISQLANTEKELLLGRGVEFEVSRVFLDDAGKWHIFATILGAGT